MKLKYSFLAWLTIALFCFSILAMPLISADSIGTFKEGLDIELYQTCNNCTYCNFTSIKYPNSTVILTHAVAVKDRTHYSYNLDGLNTTDILGVYKYCYDCGNDIEKLTGCIDFEVTSTGERVSLSNMIIVIVFLAVAGIFLVLSFTFSKDHWLLRTFFNFCAVGMGILAINSGMIIASESNSLGKMGTTGLTMGIVILALFFLYMFIYAFMEIIKVFKERGNLRWEY